jgi:lipid A disaccharide synthetase
MLKPEYDDTAMYAIHDVLIRAREMAFKQVPYQDLVNILDDAEILPTLIASKLDETEIFRKTLEKVAKQYNCASALQRFDGHIPL